MIHPDDDDLFVHLLLEPPSVAGRKKRLSPQKIPQHRSESDHRQQRCLVADLSGFEAAKLLRENPGLAASDRNRLMNSAFTTCGKLLDKLRVEHARTLLATTGLPTKLLAAQCGFGNPTRMTRAFERQLGIAPREYRVLHARSAGRVVG